MRVLRVVGTSAKLALLVSAVITRGSNKNPSAASSCVRGCLLVCAQYIVSLAVSGAFYSACVVATLVCRTEIANQYTRLGPQLTRFAAGFSLFCSAALVIFTRLGLLREVSSLVRPLRLGVGHFSRSAAADFGIEFITF